MTESPRGRFTPFLLEFSFAGDGVIRDRENSNELTNLVPGPNLKVRNIHDQTEQQFAGLLLQAGRAKSNRQNLSG